jgi:hypothetical protein
VILPATIFPLANYLLDNKRRSSSLRVFAGNVRLTASQNFCQVQICEGNFLDADANPVVFDQRMNQGQQFTGREGTQVCYRRSNNPPDCNTGLMAIPVCASHSISGTYDASLD